MVILRCENDSEALPGVLGNWGIRSFTAREQGNKSLKLKGTGNFGEQEHIENQNFYFWKQGIMQIFFRRTREQVPPGRASTGLCHT